jgi:predicted hydrocarbon binding protein
MVGLSTSQFSLHPADQDLILVDRASDPTVGQSVDGMICWYTAGLIQGVFAWATGKEHAVEEIVCRASGGDACKFRIHSLD